MLSGKGDALLAGRPLERASPWKLRPTAMGRVSRRLFNCKLVCSSNAASQPPPCCPGGYGSRWREARISLLLRLRRLDTGRTACREACGALILVNFLDGAHASACLCSAVATMGDAPGSPDTA